MSMISSGRARFHDELDPLMESIDSVRAHPNNPRNGDIDAIAQSIERNGFVSPVIAQRSTGHIIAGNHRYYALMQLGSGAIPVVWVDMDDTQAKEYMLADNRTSDLGNYDNSNLVALLQEIEEDRGDLHSTGYTDHDMEVLKHLSEMPLDDTTDFAQWPTLTFQVPPHIKEGFMKITAEAADDRERFELLLRLAGWRDS